MDRQYAQTSEVTKLRTDFWQLFRLRLLLRRKYLFLNDMQFLIRLVV